MRPILPTSTNDLSYASSETVSHVALPREFYPPSVVISPGIVGAEDCESLFTNLEGEKTVTENYLVRHSLGIQQFLGNGHPADVYRLPGLENPADEQTKVKSGIIPLPRLLESEAFRPDMLRPLDSVPSNEQAGR